MSGLEPRLDPAAAHGEPALVTNAERVEELRTSIATRLRRVCAHLPDEQFAELVQDIADVTVKYDERPMLSPPVINKRAD